MQTYAVMFANRARGGLCRRTVQAYDHAHAAYVAWRAAGKSYFPRVKMLAVDQYTFDGLSVFITKVQP